MTLIYVIHLSTLQRSSNKLVSPAWWATKLLQEHLQRWAQLQRSGAGAVAHNNYKGQDRSAAGA